MHQLEQTRICGRLSDAALRHFPGEPRSCGRARRMRIHGRARLATYLIYCCGAFGRRSTAVSAPPVQLRASDLG